jgi:hypothetical protein
MGASAAGKRLALAASGMRTSAAMAGRGTGAGPADGPAGAEAALCPRLALAVMRGPAPGCNARRPARVYTGGGRD